MSPSEPTSERVSDSTTSRRTFIGRTAAGVAAGGLVWAAPSILTLDAAAAASCRLGTHTLNWANSANNTGPGTFTSTGGLTFGIVVGTNNSGTNPANSGGGGSLGNNWTVVNNGTQVGNQTAAFWYMQMKATAGGSAQWLETTFDFGTHSPVGLTFTVYDIDIGNAGNTWTDIVTVSGRNAANALQNVTVTKAGGTGSPTLAGSGSTSGSATGTGNVGTNSTVGNVTFAFATAVKTVTIRFAAGVVTNPIQYVGVSNLTWTSCV